ncbi:hypothetical protein ACFWDN_31320 [Micromonospora chalcea]
MATKPTRTATEIAMEKLAEARALLAGREAAHDQAEEHSAELVARLNKGDDSVTALDLVTAEAEITRLGYLIKAARKALAPAERALDAATAKESPTLARFIAEHIELNPFAFGVFGMPVIVNGTQDQPGVYVNQASATQTEPATGIMSGWLGITVITPNGTPIDGKAILSGLAGIQSTGAAVIDAQASPSPAGVTIHLVLSNVKPDMPTLPAEVDGNALRNFALDLADDITSRGGEGVSGNGIYEVSVKRIRSALDTATITKQERDGEAERRTARMVFDLASSTLRREQISEYIHTSVTNLVGEMASGVGRVCAARVVSETVASEQPTPGNEFRNVQQVSVRVVVEVDAVARIAG